MANLERSCPAVDLNILSGIDIAVFISNSITFVIPQSQDLRWYTVVKQARDLILSDCDAVILAELGL